MKHIGALIGLERAPQRFAICGKDAFTFWLRSCRLGPSCKTLLKGFGIEEGENAPQRAWSGDRAKVVKKLAKKLAVKSSPIHDLIEVFSARNHGADGEKEKVDERIGAILGARVMNLAKGQMNGGRHRGLKMSR